MTDPQVALLARRLVELERTVRSMNGPQLAYSSIEEGAIREYENDTLVAQYGTQWDGTHTAASLVGPTPPRPSSPNVVGVPGGLLVGWDGFFDESALTVAPMDFARVDIAVGPVGFNPIATPPVSSFMSPRGGSHFVSLPDLTPMEVALITRTESGAASTASVIITGTPLAIAGDGTDEVARALAQDAIDDAAAAAALANAAQVSADAAVTVFRQSSAPASGMATNDLWIDSDDGLLYVWTGTWTLSADQRVATLVSSNATKITAFAQTSAPSTSGRVLGDIWVDTDDGNKTYIWDGAWTARTYGAAAISATARQLGAVTIYRQSSAPGSGMITNDMWVDSDDGLLYIYTGTWTLSADQRVATLVTSNATKITAFYQTSQPSTSGRTTGDLWFDSDDGFKPYIWNGAWTAVRDSTIAVADAKAVQAAADAAVAASAAAAAQGTANTALTSANGKNKITHADYAPTSEANTAGDTWFVHAAAGEPDAGALRAQYQGLGGTAWSASVISHQMIGSVDLGTATVGKLAANYLESGTMSAAVTVTGYLLAGNPTGARVVIDEDGIRQYGANGEILVNLPTDPSVPAQFEGTIQASSLTVLNYFTLRGIDNEIAKGAVLAVSSGTTAPGSAPSVAVGYGTYRPATHRWDYLYVPNGIHADSDDSDEILGATTFYGYGKILGRAGKWWIGAEYTDASGIKRSKYGNIGSATAIYVPGLGERVVINSTYITANGQVGAGRISVLDPATMNASGTAEPALKVQLNAKLDDYIFHIRLGRVIGIGATNYADRFTMAMMNWNSTVVQSGMITLRQYLASDTSIAMVAGTEKVITSPLGTNEQLIGATHGSSLDMGFPGTDQYIWLVHGSTNTYAYSSTMTRLPQYDFPSPAGAHKMMAFGNLQTNAFLGFRSTVWDDKTAITKLTNNHWDTTTTSSKWWLAQTWYDGDVAGTGTHETAKGPSAAITMKKRAGLVFTIPSFPERPFPNTTDDPLQAKIYVGRSTGGAPTSDPGRTYMEYQTVLDAPNRSGFIGDVTFPATTAAAPPPASSNFPATAPGKVTSSDGIGWVLAGDGKATLAGVEFDAAKPGYSSQAMRSFEFVGDGTTVSTSSLTGATMGAAGAQGTFVAPPSGAVVVTVGGQIRSSTAGQSSALGFEIKTGATIGSGTTFFAFTIDKAVLNAGTEQIRSQMSYLIGGLTPGAVYNIRTIYRTTNSSATAFAAWARLLIVPNP